MIEEVREHDALSEAKKELGKERLKENVTKFKKKLRALEDARAVVRNLERELADLEREVEVDL